jgi:hypothetical protein
MFDRCNLTLAATTHLLCCWIHTNTLEGCWPKPFQLPGKPKIQQKYRSYWKQFLCFAFRVWAMTAPYDVNYMAIYSFLGSNKP